MCNEEKGEYVFQSHFEWHINNLTESAAITVKGCSGSHVFVGCASFNWNQNIIDMLNKKLEIYYKIWLIKG